MRILIAEDDFASRILLDAVLSKWGYEVVQVFDGEAAWQALAADNAPPIAILDWMMPGLSGVEVCARVRQQPRDLSPYILMLTTKGQKADVSFGLDAGADDYLTKPFDLVELGARLRVAKRSITMQTDLIAAKQDARYQALHDGPTGALNRGAIISALSGELRGSAPVSIGLYSIDGYKLLQERFGATCAEATMRHLVHCVRSEHPTAHIGRYGADELLVVMPDGGIAQAVALAERVRATPTHASFAASVGIDTPLTLSIGVAGWDGAASSELLLCYADTALYAARNTGNAVDIFDFASEYPAKAG
jgi:diguanylate cyclase (GGDEF)-like protein